MKIVCNSRYTCLAPGINPPSPRLDILKVHSFQSNGNIATYKVTSDVKYSGVVNNVHPQYYPQF